METFLLGLVVGFLTNLLTAYLFEKFRTPNLEIRIGAKTPSNPLPHGNGVQYSFLHLEVFNKNKFNITNAALSVRARISFKNPQDNKEIFYIDGRWSGNPEPYIPMNASGTEGRVNPTAFPLLRKMDILPGESQELDIAIKYDDDDAIFAFSNESYIPSGKMWCNDAWRIDLKKILLDVTVNSGDLRVNKQFFLINPGKETDGVSIEPLSNK